MRLTFERTTLVMLFSCFVLIATMTSLVVFLILQNESQQQSMQVRANQTEMRIINTIFDKLDTLNSHTNFLIAAQGNITQHQRQQLIQEFEAITSEGGLATKNVQIKNGHILQEILSNITQRQQH